MSLKSKKRVGRPTDYDEAYHCKKAYELALLGVTQKEMAAAFNISEATLYEWKLKYSEFTEAISRGGTIADAEVVAAVRRSALGHRVKLKNKIVGIYYGDPVTADVEEYIPPSVQAQKLWLQNRRNNVPLAAEGETPAVNWGDKKSVDLTSKGEKLQVFEIGGREITF